MLGAQIFIIVISSSWLDPSLSHFTAFISKSILCDMSIATPAFFWSPFALNIFYPALHFQFVCVTCFEMGLLYTAYLGVLFLYPFSQSLSFGWSIQPIYI